MKLGSMKQGLVIIMAALLLQGAAWAQGGADATLLAMRDAFRRNNITELDTLLPELRGHALEPLARYWAIKARLETSAPQDIRNALAQMAGTYWEDRLRNDWLLLLGKNRDWVNFEAELPRYRMNDDPQLQCYALLLDAAARRRPAEEAARQTAQRWLAQPDAEDGCATAAQAFLTSGHLTPETAWQRARLALDANKPRAATQAVALLDPESVPILESIIRNPAAYLDDKFTAIRPRTKELVTLAAIRLAASDPAAAAQEMHNKRWVAQLTQEERSWAWGVIGRRAAKRLQPDALAHFVNGQDQHLHDEHLAWMARAGLRAGAWGHVRDAIGAMS
jgi:soluble lytic murein transglycosylase